MAKIARDEAIAAVKKMQLRNPIFAAELRGLFFGRGVLEREDMDLLNAQAKGPAMDGEQSFAEIFLDAQGDAETLDKITDLLLRENVSMNVIAEILRLCGRTPAAPEAQDEPPPFPGRPRPGGSRDPGRTPAMDGARRPDKSFASMFPGAENISSGGAVTPSRGRS